MEEERNKFYEFLCKAVNLPVLLYIPKGIVIKLLYIEASTLSYK